MSTTGQVAVFTGVRKPFELREFPVPQPEPGAILVKVHMANVCGSDLHIWRGHYDVSGGQSEPLCLAMGHEMVGEVVVLGDGVTHDSAGEPLGVGDRIVYQYFSPCGRCRSCLKGSTPRCPQGVRYRYTPAKYPHFNGAYGQYYYLRSSQTVFKVPPNVPDDLAGPANCALSQVIEAFQRGGLTLGDHVVIQGAGGLGINAVAVAREMGAAQIIVIDGIDSRLELARDFGADETIHMSEFPQPQDRIQRVKQLTDGYGADVVLEVVGLPQVIPEGIAMLCQGGTYLEVGNISQHRTVEIDPSVLVHGGNSFLGIMWYRPHCLQKALELLSTKADKYPFHKILSHHYPLEHINEAFHDQDAGTVQRAALLPWAQS